MKNLLICLRRCLGDLPFMAALLAIVIVISLAPAAGGAAEYPPPGVCSLDEGETSPLIVNALEGAGFIPCATREELENAVQDGSLDCGIVILPGLDEQLCSGHPNGVLVVITSPMTANEAAARLNAAALLYRYSAPYITADVLAQYEVEEAAVLAEYERYFSDGLAFSFEVTTAKRAESPVSARPRAVTMLAAALCLFALCCYGGAGVLGRHFDTLAARIGLREALFSSALPQLLLRWLLMCLAAAAGLIFGGFGELILPAAAWLLALCGLSALLTGILGDGTAQHTLLALMLVGGAALCPVFTDLSLTLPFVKAVQLFMPPCWLWWAAEKPLLWFLGALILLPACLWLMCLVKAVRGRLRL